MKKILILISIPFLSLFATENIEFIGKIKKVKGKAYIERENKKIDISAGDKVFKKDILTTKRGGIGITLNDNTIISIGKNSSVSVSEFLFEPVEKKVALETNVLRGTAVFLTGTIAKLNKDAMKIKTKTATMGIRGTYFAVKVEEE